AGKSDGVYIAIGSVDAGGFIRSSPCSAAAGPRGGGAVHGVQSAGRRSCRVNKGRETERSQGEKYSQLQVRSSGPANTTGSVFRHRKILLQSIFRSGYSFRTRSQPEGGYRVIRGPVNQVKTRFFARRITERWGLAT